MKDSIRYRLEFLAKKLPAQIYPVRETTTISGEDVLLAGTNEIDGKPVEKKETYRMNVPAYYEANHYRRLKRAYKRNGKEGVIHYLNAYTAKEKRTDIIKFVNQIFSY